MLCAFGSSAVAQDNLYKSISDAEKTVFSITTYNRSGGLIGKSTGFFIGGIGLAVCQASIFIGADSIKIVDPNNQRLRVERVVAVHQPADLAIIKLVAPVKFRFDFLFPKTTIFREDDEVLIFSNPELGSDGSQLEHIVKILDKPFFNRIGILKTNLGASSVGSPVINSKGELVGVTGFFRNENPSFIYGAALLSDSNWVNINMPLAKLKESVLKQNYLNPNLNRALLSISFEDWIGAAKFLTAHLKTFNNDALCYTLRGYARYKYNNKEESKIDFRTSRTINSSSFLNFYYQALIAQTEGDYERAYTLADSSVYYQYKFAQSRVLRGNLILKTNRPINNALLDYSYAIQTNPEYADGYFFRAIFLKKYTKNLDLAYNDIKECVKLNPSMPYAHHIKGQMEMDNQDYIEALKSFNKAINITPADDKALFSRGFVNYNLGLKSEACEDWKRASDLGNEEAMNNLLKYCNVDQLMKPGGNR